MSIRMRSGCSDDASAIPASASTALNEVWPADSSRNVARVMFAGLSSTTRTFAISGWDLAARDSSPDFTGESTAIEISLLQNRRHQSVQLATILGGYRLRRDNQYWDVGGAWLLVERLHDVEPGHVRHHEIEYDEVGQFASGDVDCVAATIGAQDLARQTIDVERDQIDRARIVVDDEYLQRAAGVERNQSERNER